MTRRLKFLLLLVLFSSVLALCAAVEDPELQQCKHQCKHQLQFDEDDKVYCEQKCDDYIRQKKEIEREEGEERKEMLRGCRSWCDQRQEGREKERCMQGCEEEKFGKKHQQGHEHEHAYLLTKEDEDPQEDRRCMTKCRLKKIGARERRWCEESCREIRGREREGKQHEENPYVFEEEHFDTVLKTEEGRFSLLEKFTERSDLLRGIENYRVGFLEANPLTFISPVHLDSDVVFFVAKGRGTVTMIREEGRESFDVKCGDVVRVPAGTPVYMINRDENEKLFLVKFFSSVNLPGHVESFFGPGGEDPESFYRAFSWEILEAAFKVERDRLERLFSQQKHGTIMKASREQIRGMSHKHHEGGGGVWPFGSESSGPISLLNQHPSKSNEFGELFEAHPHEHKQLRDLDLLVSFANITKGSMSAPFYNSKATKIGIVVDGEGCFEMACPHVSSSKGISKGSQRYQKINAPLKRWTIFIAPAGHPFVTVASKNHNLQVICFEVNANNNVRFPLAGRRNIVNEMEREAKELAFGVPAREVDRIFRKQEFEFFLPGPRGHGRASM